MIHSIPLQPRYAVTAFFGLLATSGITFLSILYNLVQAPFRLLKAVERLLGLPWVGIKALFGWINKKPINPLTIDEQKLPEDLVSDQNFK